jgi:hypothetical protein
MRFVLLGEQATGKSSLLVALYGALVNRRAGELRIVRTIDDVEFLSRGLEAFGRRESVRRTEVDSHARLLIEVAHHDDVVSVELPDRSGELVRHMIQARTWEPELQRHVREAAGALLFLRADLVGSASAAPVPPLEAVEPPPWTPAEMPVDVRAVDLLQSLLEERPSALPLAVIVSAWDRAGTDARSPSTWLAGQVPLLDQFLSSHYGQLPYTVFGVSAQGSAFAGEAEATSDGEDPWDRAFIVGPDGTPGTLADPIVWLIDAVR